MGMASIISSGIAGVGGAVSTGASLVGQVKSQAEVFKASGESDQVGAQRDATAAQDKNAAAMIKLASDANVQKLQTDTLAGIAAGELDSTGKWLSSGFTGAKTVQY